MQSAIIDVVIVGAGPYALSLAAHLKVRGVGFRIFGHPMQAWRDMPLGMFLKSFGFATNVYTPDGRLSFVSYCQDRGLEGNEPCSIADFARYGTWVQRQLLPELEPVTVSGLSRMADGFSITLSNKRNLHARQVVIAVGITHFARMPENLAVLGKHLASHTSHHRDYKVFAGKDVCVIGGGQSALEAARLLFEAGARPQLLARDASIRFSEKMPAHRSGWERIRRPQSGLGPGMKNRLLESFPLALHFLPDRWRLPFVKSHLGPQGAWWVRDLIMGKIPTQMNCTILSASPKDDRAVLRVRIRDRGSSYVTCDHVIAGTGYDIDVDKLDFIDPELRQNIRRLERGPALDWTFQSSVPGLYFIGPASSVSFGPLFRFVVGAAYTSRALSRVLFRRSRRRAEAVSLAVKSGTAGATQ